mgnify:CR=1 FL=1
MKKTEETIVLINCGYESIQKFARAIREQHIYTMVMPYSVSVERVMEEKPQGVILVAEKNDPAIAEHVRKFANLTVPMLTAGAATEMLPGLKSIPLNDPSDAADACKFCFDVCGCKGSWRMDTFIEEAVADIREQVGDGTVVLGLSGGVDSSVVAALIHRAIGDRLTCVFVNHGLLRKNEPEMVREVFEKTFKMKLVYIDATDRFLDKLVDVNEPEKKRKIIGKEFIDVFAEAAEKTHAPFLGQGTIYPDILESIPLDGNPESVIKSHHNVGGLPSDLKFKLVEPLERLFKNEVRQVGKLLGLPDIMLNRHPFPGPGLGVRHVGAIDRKTLNVLREADAIVTEELLASGWYAKTWQTFAIFVPVNAVGVKDGKRTYDNVIAIRSINSIDAVTADVVELPWELLLKMGRRIATEVAGVSRVVYDITPKPPATIEWE